MWHELKGELALERAQLRKALSDYAPLRARVQSTSPDLIEISALATFLHSFYNGIENLFRRIAVHLDGGPPLGAFWHSELLKRMMEPGTQRPPVLDRSTYELIRQYMDFRHMFRHAYSHELRWVLMAPLVRDSEHTFAVLEAQLDAFISAMDIKADYPVGGHVPDA